MSDKQQHPVSDLMDVTIQRIKEMVDGSTVIGEPVSLPDGGVILPVSKISFGFASGGSDIGGKSAKELFGGGGGAGLTVAPVAFLVCKANGDVRLLQISTESGGLDKLMNLVPEVMDKVSGFAAKKKEDDGDADASGEE
ncbi:MAG: GerW family sporulation protein [Oscillospiraceae bacterium]|nr:GerW family sporulation protein [Oscillospiraceae bacterium]